MTSKLAIAYAKYCLAVKKGVIDDDTRNAISLLFSEESLFEKFQIIGVVINTIFNSYKEKDRLDLAKEECLKLKFGLYVPEEKIFSKVLDLLCIHRNDDFDIQIQAMKDVFTIIITGNRNIDPFYKAVLKLMIQRLIVIKKGDEIGINADPEFSSQVISRLEELEDVEDYIEFFVWYC